MSYTSFFPTFPDDARCWFYVADRPLGDDEQQRMLTTLDTFFDGWTSHARTVRGAARFIDDRILVVVATLNDGDISGCGIDSSVHAVEQIAREHGVAWDSPLKVVYRDAAGAVQVLSRSAFRKLVRAGEADADTTVFDLSVTSLGALRGGAFETSAGATWHARVFGLAQPTP